MNPTVTLPSIGFDHWQHYFFAQYFITNKSVLDIDCNEGLGSFFLSQSAQKVVALTDSEQSAQDAMKKYGGKNLEYRSGYPGSLPIEGKEIFDIAIAFGALDYISHEERRNFLVATLRLLKPEGLLIISTAGGFPYGDRVIKSQHEHFDGFKTYLKTAFSNVAMLEPLADVENRTLKLVHSNNKSDNQNKKEGMKVVEPDPILSDMINQSVSGTAICSNVPHPIDLSAVVVEISGQYASLLQNLFYKYLETFERMDHERSRAEEMDKELGRVRNELDQTNAELVAFAMSTSWRITRPLRKLMNVIRRR